MKIEEIYNRAAKLTVDAKRAVKLQKEGKLIGRDFYFPYLSAANADEARDWLNCKMQMLKHAKLLLDEAEEILEELER